MRSKLSFLLAACALASLIAGCAKKTADADNANSANANGNVPPASSTASQTSATSQTPGAASSPGVAVQPAETAGTSAGGMKMTDACALLSSDDIKSVQGEGLKETKGSRRPTGSLSVAQCFFTTETFNKSVSLEVTQGADGASVRRFWDERFARAREESGKSEREREREKKQREREREREKKKGEARGGEEEEEEGSLPVPVRGVGDEAYWAAGGFNGTLYARKGDSIVRVSLGGADDDATRLRKAKALAQKALARL
jgi:hypothetical protein